MQNPAVLRERILRILRRNYKKGPLTHAQLRRKLGYKDATYSYELEAALRSRRIVTIRYNPVIGQDRDGEPIYGGRHARAYQLSEGEWLCGKK